MASRHHITVQQTQTLLWFYPLKAETQTYRGHAEDVSWTPAATEQLADPLKLAGHGAEPRLDVLRVSLDQEQSVGILLARGLQQHDHLLHL